MMANASFKISALCASLLLFGIGAALFAENPLRAPDLLRLLADPSAAQSFDEFYYAYGTLPRLFLALAGGALLGVVGALLQQLTRNPMTSPLTLGTSSGAWLAIVAATAFAPSLSADGLAFAAFSGALSAFGLIAAIAGPRGMTGPSLIVAGMVVNLLFGAAATSLILLQSDFVSNVFLWGAGDLAQNGWAGAQWLLWRTLPVFAFVLLFSPRAIALLSLGEEGARARGLAAAPVFLLFAALGVWLASAFITTAGVINFTGLIAPNIARAAGWRSPRKCLWGSLFVGAALLAATDGAAVLLSAATESIVPTGVISAVLGTPVFILLALRTMKARPGEAARGEALARGLRSFGVKAAIALLALILLCACATLFVTRTADGWAWEAPSAMAAELRLPRLITSLSAGASLAAAGVILQRLTGNPLASPDILGVTSGATVAMVLAALFFGAGVGAAGAPWALLGSFAVLGLILQLSRRSHYSPSIVVLLGIAVSAFLDAFTALMLSRGTMENYFILQWLSGTTYKATLPSALSLALAAALLIGAAFTVSRSLSLFSIGRAFASARGLAAGESALGLLTLCALLCAAAVSVMGPVAFVGLAAPHIAALLGARTAKAQLAAASLSGAAIVGWSDWLGQVLIAPAQLPAGTLAALFGAAYFLALLLWQRLGRKGALH